MLGRASGACFGAAAVLAALALGSAQLNQGREQSSASLDTLTAIFIAASVVFLSLCVIFAVGFVVVRVWRFFHAVEVITGEWYFRFWPHERKAQASGIAVRVREWAGVVKVKCHARFGRDEVDSIAEISAGSNGTFTLQFPQQKADLESDPNEGDVAWLVVKAWPSWWRGGQSERIQMVKIGVTDHRPAPIATREQERAKEDADIGTDRDPNPHTHHHADVKNYPRRHKHVHDHRSRVRHDHEHLHEKAAGS